MDRAGLAWRSNLHAIASCGRCVEAPARTRGGRALFPPALVEKQNGAANLKKVAGFDEARSPSQQSRVHRRNFAKQSDLFFLHLRVQSARSVRCLCRHVGS